MGREEDCPAKLPLGVREAVKITFPQLAIAKTRTTAKAQEVQDLPS